MLKISVSGIRGIWGEDLNPESILSFTKAFAHFIVKQNLTETPTIVIGSDTRPTSPVFKSMVCSFLQTFGFQVIDLGVLATPIVLFAVRKLNAQGGIVITASHNPLEWNAFKCVTHEGLFFNSHQIQELEALQEQNFPIDFSYKTIGSLKIDNSLIDQYLDTIIPYFQVDKIKESSLRVSADLINGTASSFFPILMQYLGLEYTTLHNDVYKAFERGAEPKPENLSALQAKVVQRKADIGFAFDPDGDRLALINEKGETIGENWTLVVAYLCFLKLHKPQNKDIVVNLSTSMIIDQLADAVGAKVYRVPVGEIHVTTALLKNAIELGGEGNGGVIFPTLNPCRDSILAVLFILEYLAVANTRLSSIMKEFKIPNNLTTDIKLSYSIDIQSLKPKLISLASELSLENPKIDEQDGLRMDYLGGWIQVRLSNTEPILRIMGESYNSQQQEKILENIQTWF